MRGPPYVFLLHVVVSAVVCLYVISWYCINSYNNTRKAVHKSKLILSWVPFFGDSYFSFGVGTQAFKSAGCAYTNCEITADRSRVPIDQFDAILFHGFEYFEPMFGVPYRRHPSQLYVFMSLESSDRTPIVENKETFYNYTITYRLDSDAPWVYFKIYDIDGRHVAPAISPDWSGNGNIDSKAWNSTLKLIASKTKPLAWFVSHCETRSRREIYAKTLSAKVSLDVYGDCGTMSCPAKNHKACAQMVGEKYYFYLAFENSLCEDYITEKAAWAMAAGAVPVIRSGANLSRFFPSGSYLESDDDPDKLAERLNKLLKSRKDYEKMLSWRARYRIVLWNNKRSIDSGHPFCNLCAKLNDETPILPRAESVRSWWMNKGYAYKC